MIENFKCGLDRGEYTACISMDISKAFDCLPHCLTICKLHAYGLSGNACTLIASYLYQRKQRKETDKGVPQGSILGPLIFNIFTNDLFYFVKHANLSNYADDNSVSVSGKELSIVSRLLRPEAEVTVRWFHGSVKMQWRPIRVNSREFSSRVINKPMISSYLLMDTIWILQINEILRNLYW